MERREKQLVVIIALIKNPEGKILLQKRNDPSYPLAHGKWEFPGGGVDFGEKPEDALIRECEEEIGCGVEIIRLLPLVWSAVWRNSNAKAVQVIIICYECRIKNGTPSPANSEVEETLWVRREEISEYDVLPGIKEFVQLV